MDKDREENVDCGGEGLPEEIQKPVEEAVGDTKGTLELIPGECEVRIIKIQNLQKGLFSKYREFTLKTTVVDWIVKRSREDLKWLTKTLDREYPTKIIHKIGHGELNKKTIEHFFKNLFKDEELRNSRFLKFFLKSEKVKFKEQVKKVSNSWVSSLAKKFGNNDKMLMEELKLSERKDGEELSPEEKKKLHLFLDNMKELQSQKTSAMGKINALMRQAAQKLGDLSKIFFKVGDLVHSIDETMTQIEALCESKLETPKRQSDMYKMIKLGLYGSAELYSKSQANLKKCVLPLVLSLQQDSGHIHSMFQLKHNLSKKHGEAFEAFRNKPTRPNRVAKESLAKHIESLNLKIYEAFLDSYSAQDERIRKTFYNYGMNQLGILKNNSQDWSKLNCYVLGKAFNPDDL